MNAYRMAGTSEAAEGGLLVATHAAETGTYIVFARKGGGHHRTPVVLWGVQQDGLPVPISLSGVWNGVTNTNMFVMHPDGRCSAFERSWDSLESAIQDMMRFDDYGE